MNSKKTSGSRKPLPSLYAAVLCVLICVLLFSCGHSKPAMTTMTTAGAKQSTTASVQKAISLADVLRSIDAVPVPKNADPALFERLRAKLKELVVARSKDGKTISIFRPGDMNTVSDLTAVSDAQNQHATVTWTEKLKGDYNNNGTVDAFDLGPVALYYGMYVGTYNQGDPNNCHNLVDGTYDPVTGLGAEITITELEAIAANTLAHITGYQVYRGLMVNGAIVWDRTYRPPPPHGDYTIGRPDPPPVSVRPSYSYSDDLTDDQDKGNTWYKVCPYDAGPPPETGPFSNEAQLQQYTYTVSGTVTISGTQPPQGLEGATVTLIPQTGTVAPTKSATTISDGTYSITGVVNGYYDLSGAMSGYSFPVKTTVQVNNADVTGQDMAATPGVYSISGTVVNGNDPTEAIQGVTIKLWSYTLQQYLPSVTTDNNGAFSFPTVGLGQYRAEASKSGYNKFVGDLITLNVEFHLDGNIANVHISGYASLQSAPAAWPKFHLDKLNTGATMNIGSQTNAVKWTHSFSSAVNSSPALGVYTHYMQGTQGGWQEVNDPRLYIGCDDNNVYAINPANGSTIWSHATGGIVRSGPVVGADSVVYVGSSDSYAYAFKPDGNIRASMLLTGPIVDSPTIDDNGLVYFGTCLGNDGTFYQLKPMHSSFQPIWAKDVLGNVHSSPAVGVDGHLYVGTDYYSLCCYLPDGTLDWRFFVDQVDMNDGAAVYASPVIGPHTGSGNSLVYNVFIATKGNTMGHVYAVERLNGGKVWRSSEDLGPISSSPALGTDGTLYVGSDNGYVYALSSSDGSIKWKHLTGGSVSSSPAVGADGIVYVGSADKKVYALSPSDGSVLWSYTTEGAIISSPAIGSDGTVYIGSGDDNLYAFGGTGSATWSVTGTVTMGGQPLQGVPLSVQPLGFSTNTLSDGTYEINGLPNGSYTVTPAWRGFTFTPPFIQITVNGATVTGQDFTATRVPWLKFHSDKFSSGSSRYLGPATNPTLKWSTTLVQQVRSCPAVDWSGNVYVGDDYGYLASYSPSGTLNWTHTMGGIVQSSPEIMQDGTVYVGCNDGYLYALDSTNYGNLKWRHLTMGAIYGSPVVDSNGNVYVGSLDGNVYSVSATGALNWQLPLDSPIWSSPALSADESTLYIGTYGIPQQQRVGRMYAIATTGTVLNSVPVLWRLNSGSIESSPAVAEDGTIYFGCDNGCVYALSPINLGQIGVVSLTRSVRSSPAVATRLGSERIVVGCDNGLVYCFSSHLPSQIPLWSTLLGTFVYSSPAVGGDGTVYVGSIAPTPLYAVHSLNWSTGGINWSYQTNGQVSSSPAISADGAIYIGSAGPGASGTLYKIGSP